MATITTLGSGSSGNAYIVEMSEVRFLIECGLRWTQILKGLNFKLPDFCLISHEHGDHCQSVRNVYQSGIPIFCSGGTADALDIIETPLSDHIKLIDLVHDGKEPTGFIVDIDTERLVYITDTRDVNYNIPGVTHLMIEANWSIPTMDPNCRHKERTMQTHLSLEKCCKWVKEMNKSKLVEVHLIHLSDGNSSESYFKEEVQKVCGVPVYVS